jgi:short-subunit dehydrogenase
VIAARTADKLAETKRECEQYTSDVHTVIADVSKEEDCREIVNKTVEEFGGIDILILNAAYSPTHQFFTDSKKPVSTPSSM